MLALWKVKFSTFWKLYFDMGILKIMESERTSFSSHPHSRLLPFLSKSWFLSKSPLWDPFPPGQLTSEQSRGKSEKWPHRGNWAFRIYRLGMSCWAFLTFKVPGGFWHGLSCPPSSLEESRETREQRSLLWMRWQGANSLPWITGLQGQRPFSSAQL